MAIRFPSASAHALPAGEVLSGLGASTGTGLSGREAKSRLARYGPNALRVRRPVTLLNILRSQFESPVIALLGAAAVVAFLFGEWKEGAAIAVVLAINAVIGFATELRAVRSMEALRILGGFTTRIRRDGRSIVVPAQEIVPGDMVVLEGGDVVTADLRLVEASNLSTDESTLTGESVAVAKHIDPVAVGAPVAERTSMVFKGTAITRGSGLGVVVATGMQTELGRISQLVEEAKPERTPLERQLERLSGQLIRFTLVIVVVIGALGIAYGQDVFLMIEAAIALAVAAIPEGLPIVATMALARGMWRMARHNALIERLAAVETLGAATVIFSDKTGTLTENKMALGEVWLAAGHVQLAAEPPGFALDGRRIEVDEVPHLGDALTAMVLCNNAELGEGEGRDTGDPMELALLRAGRLGGLRRAELLRSQPEVREVAFDTETKMMATVHRSDDAFVVFVKGAPEAVLAHATEVAGKDGTKTLGKRRAGAWLKRTNELAERGMRVLAIAMKQVPTAETPAYGGLVFLGLLGLHDPPRADVPDAISRCREAGIRVVMITGDHAVTARNIAAAIGLAGPDATVIEGPQLKAPQHLSAAELQEVRSADVFARVNPGQKLDIVSIFQTGGEIVAMTGDGVNDAPALKKADIGIAMGVRGTQVAREAAAMVLRDDAFTTIVAAIREGRAIFRNIQRFVTYLLSCNLSEILVVGLAILAGLPLPLLPLQILFLNLVTDVLPAFALGIGEADRQVLQRPPRDPAKPIITRALWIEIIGHGVVITLATLGALFIARSVLALEGEAAVTVSFLTLALAQLWHVFNMRDPRSGMLWNSITRNVFVWAALALSVGILLAASYTPAVAEILHLHRPDWRTWLLILAISFVPVVIGQAGKELAALQYKWRSRAR
ncbi:MAG: cation-translocating P-type ATPase [Hyphomicrobiales bacterium]|nr:cation-translocating P-type ATPase [Hyphomicrobiales bacterium]